MRAVNLIPSDQRRGGIGAPGRSGMGAHLLLGALGVIVVAAAAYVLVGNSITSRKDELATVNRDAAQAQARAAALRPYKDFAALSQARVATVSSLAASRFDWERVIRQLSQALPGDVWLTSLVGTVTPGVTLEGSNSSGNTGSLRSALQVPALELVGCTESQAEVSRVMARLRLIHGVTRVSLASSEKSDAATTGGTAAPTSGGGGGSADCRNGSRRFPQFQLVVFFEAPTASQGGTPAPGPQSAGSQPAPAAPSQPAATPTSAPGGTR